MHANRHKQPTIPKGKTTPPTWPRHVPHPFAESVEMLRIGVNARGGHIVAIFADRVVVRALGGRLYIHELSEIAEDTDMAKIMRCPRCKGHGCVCEGHGDYDTCGWCGGTGATPTMTVDDPAPSDQFPSLPIVIPIDVEPVTLRMGGNGRSEFIDRND